MSAFSLDTIDDLKPQERRYDVAIEDDFVLSVLPNGIKTWVFVYEQDGRMQRRTLGVYPDMSAELARKRLAAARATRKSLQDAMERSARATAARPQRRRPTPRRPALTPAAIVAASVVVLAGTYVAWRGFHGREDDTLTELPAAARDDARQSAAEADTGGEAAAAPAAAMDTAPTAVTASASQDDDTMPAGDLDHGVPPPARDTIADASEPGATGSLAAAPPAADETPPSAPVEDLATEDADTGAADAPSRAAPVGAPPATAPAASAADASTAAAPTHDSAAATARPPATPAAQPTAAGATDAEASPIAKLDKHVARAQLTSDVVKHEPVDAIGPQIEGTPGGVTKVCFYTELRGLAGEELHYRWEREGRVMAEVPLKVGKSWRWRAYSRKDVRADQTGRWRVQLIDQSQRVLAEARFVYLNDNSDTQSADAD